MALIVVAGATVAVLDLPRAAASSTTDAASSTAITALAQSQYKAWKLWLGRPAQVKARAVSRKKFADASAAKAKAIDNAAFPGEIGASGFRVFGGKTGVRLVRRLSGTSALVTFGHGRRALEVGTQPLWGKTPSGVTAPLNLTLTANGPAAFSPTSSLVPVSIPSSSSGSLTFPGVGVSVAFGGATPVVGQQEGQTVFYPNVGGTGNATDIVAQATSDGAEISYVLRSQSSSDSEALSFHLPSGWNLITAADGSGAVDIVNSAGTIKGLIPAAIATDAQGQSVPVTYQIVSSTQLRVNVNVSAGSFAYPIDVDPQWLWVGDLTISAGDWSVAQSVSTIVPWWNTSSAVSGMKLVAGDSYTAGQWGEYRLNAPANGYIYEMVEDAVNNTAGVTTSGAGINTFVSGIRSSAGVWENGTWLNSNSGNHGAPTIREYLGTISSGAYEFCSRSSCEPDSGIDDGNQAMFGISIANSGKVAASPLAEFSEGEVVVMIDDASTQAPTFTVSHSGYQPGTWINNSTNASTDAVSFSATQSGGLGVSEVDVSGNVSAGGKSFANACTATAGQISCPSLTNQSFSYSTSGLPEGQTVVTMKATPYDEAPTTSTTWTVNVDNTAPAISLTGALAPSGGSNASVAPGSGALSATATDGTGAVAVSGVSAISASLDGSSVSAASNAAPCGQNATPAVTQCSSTATWTVNTSKLSAGWHTLAVSAVDGAGNRSTQNATFAVLSPPTVSGTDQVGQTLSATAPAFSGTPAPSYSFQWQSCAANGQNCVNIPNATSSSYVLAAGDVGSDVRVQETATATGMSALTQPSPVTGLIEPANGAACTDSWIASGAGSWSTGSNWSTGSAPSSSDIVCIRSGYSLGSTASITSSGSAGVLQANAAGVSLSSGAQLTIATASTASSIGALQLGSATIALPSGGALTVAGATVASGASAITGAGASVNLQGGLSGASTTAVALYVTGQLTIAGPISNNGDVDLTVGGSYSQSGPTTASGGFNVISSSGAVQLGGAISATVVTVNAAGQITVGASITAAAVNLASPGTSVISASQTLSSLTLAGGGTAKLSSPVTVSSLTANGESVYNEGTLTIGGRLLEENGAQVLNDAVISADGALFATAPNGAPSALTNDSGGQMTDPNNPKSPDDFVTVPFTNNGATGSVSAAYLINSTGAAQYGGVNEATPNMVADDCDEDTDCGNGDQSETETDLSVAGLGGALSLTRTYSSRLAASEAAPGMFGYGWTSAFESRLFVDAAAGIATVQTSTGAIVSFTISSSGAFVPAAGVYATLTAGSNGQYTYMTPEQVTTVFSSTGLPLTVTNRAGQTTTYQYNNGQLTQVIAPSAASGVSGRTISFTYNAQGRVATASDSAGLTVTYQYDQTTQNLTSVTDSAGPATTQWQYAYDGEHELTKLTDADGNSTTIAYQGGYVVSVTDPLGRVETWQYLTPGNSTATTAGETIETSPAGNVTQTFFNSADEPTTTILPTGATTVDAYDSSGNLTASTDANGHTTHYTYDSSGNKLTETDALGDTTTWTYDSLRDVLTQTLPSGSQTAWTYNSAGEPTEVTVSGSGVSSATTTSSYNGYEELTSQTTPMGDTTSYTYDNFGDLASSTDALGNKTTYTYDGDGRKLTEVAPEGNVSGATASQHQTSYAYDALGDLTSETLPDGGIDTWSYDGDQNKLSATNADGHTTSYTYDADGELRKTTLPDGSTQIATYTPDGELASQTNGDGDATGYTYTPNDQVASIKDPLGQVTSYGYDSAGKLTTTTSPSVNGTSQVTTRNYDSDERLATISYSNGDPTVSFTYTVDGLRASMNDASGAFSYSYDGLDRLTGVSEDGRKVSYTYNADNDQMTIGYPNGQSVQRTFNADDQLASVSDWLGNKSTFSYTPDSELASTVFPSASGETDVDTYNNDDALASVSMGQGSGTLASITLTRDKDELVTAQAQTGLPGTASIAYTYNADEQLTGAGSLAYSYDKAHNLTELDSTSGLTYNADSELTASASTSYTYNSLGERTSAVAGSTTSTYGYDSAQSLTSVSVPTGSASYTYDGDGQLMSRVAAGTTTAFTWDDTATDPQLLSAGSESFIYGPSGAIEQISSGGTVQYLHQDQIGSTRLITSSSGSVVGASSYNPYGAVQSSNGTVTSLLGYAGQYTDPTTGFEYDQARWYDPTSGQFMVVDPKVQTTWQPYAYADNDPELNTDPSGDMYEGLRGKIAATCAACALGFAPPAVHERFPDDGPPRAVDEQPLQRGQSDPRHSPVVREPWDDHDDEQTETDKMSSHSSGYYSSGGSAARVVRKAGTVAVIVGVAATVATAAAEYGWMVALI